jgi:hypothetical protein
MTVPWAIVTWIRDEIDHVAVGWILRRRDLDRAYARLIVERLAERAGAKVELTELPEPETDPNHDGG